MVHSKIKPSKDEVPGRVEMKYLVYTAKSPSGRVYIGVTSNFKRRIKEHLYSKYPFGHALRKYGKDNFTFSFESYDTLEEALNREAELVTQKEVSSKKYYNICVGGTLSNVLQNQNPMHDPEVVEKHPNIWSSENNPMFDEESKKRMIKNQKCKKVSVNGVEYYGVREAARSLNISRQCLVHRLKSKTFPTYYYV